MKTRVSIEIPNGISAQIMNVRGVSYNGASLFIYGEGVRNFIALYKDYDFMRLLWTFSSYEHDNLYACKSGSGSVVECMLAFMGYYEHRPKSSKNREPIGASH